MKKSLVRVIFSHFQTVDVEDVVTCHSKFIDILVDHKQQFCPLPFNRSGLYSCDLTVATAIDSNAALNRESSQVMASIFF